MVNLPQDIMFDVFSRLPVKSVARLRCVCKSWRTLISKPEFVKMHLNRAITDITVGCQRILIPWNRTLESIDYEALQRLSEKELKEALRNKGGNACRTVLDFPWSGPIHHVVRSVGTCHGMVAILVDSDKIVLYNPCTREFRELPKPTSIIIYYGIKGGLGYDSYVDDYKFVIAFYDDRHSQFKAEVFSLRNNSWRIIQDIPRDISYISGFEQGLYLNGALHWIAFCKTHGLQIISFDLATEKFQKPLPLPPDQGDKRRSSNDNYRNLIILGGCLSVSNTRFSRETNVWVMKDYGVEASWTKLCTLDIRFCEAPMHPPHSLMPVCFSKNGELLVDVDDKFIVYYQQDQNSRMLYNCGGSGWWFNRITQYIESLVSPNVRLERISSTSNNSQKKKKRQRRVGMKLE